MKAVTAEGEDVKAKPMEARLVTAEPEEQMTPATVLVGLLEVADRVRLAPLGSRASQERTAFPDLEQAPVVASPRMQPRELADPVDSSGMVGAADQEGLVEFIDLPLRGRMARRALMEPMVARVGLEAAVRQAASGQPGFTQEAERSWSAEQEDPAVAEEAAAAVVVPDAAAAAAAVAAAKRIRLPEMAPVEVTVQPGEVERPGELVAKERQADKVGPVAVPLP